MIVKIEAPEVDHENLASGIYTGTVRHRRFSPKANHFVYKVFMVYLDLQEFDQVFSRSRLWSSKRFNLAWFKRSDYLDGDNSKALYDSVADLVAERTGKRLDGPIRMLTNLRYFGFIINPITCYYCFSQDGSRLETIVAEVTNTPWRNRIQYVLTVSDEQKDSGKQKFLFAKDMHVSPFQPMDLEYAWKGKTPADDLLIHLDVNCDTDTVLDATLVLERQEMTTKVMNVHLLLYPLMTVKVFAGIYWQALKLFLKGISYHPNPHGKLNTNNSPTHSFDSSGAK